MWEYWETYGTHFTTRSSTIISGPMEVARADEISGAPCMSRETHFPAGGLEGPIQMGRYGGIDRDARFDSIENERCIDQDERIGARLWHAP